MKTITINTNIKFAFILFIMFFSILSEAGHNRSWQFEEEVHFTDRKTAVAIRNCEREQYSDFRCSARAYKCTSCSRIKHSDHSSYIVYSKAGRNGHRVERTLVDTIDFYHRKTAKARRNCESYRRRTWQCNSSSYECTPCTIESHTDHSEFSIYELVGGRRGRRGNGNGDGNGDGHGRRRGRGNGH